MKRSYNAGPETLARSRLRKALVKLKHRRLIHSWSDTIPVKDGMLALTLVFLGEPDPMEVGIPMTWQVTDMRRALTVQGKIIASCS